MINVESNSGYLNTYDNINAFITLPIRYAIQGKLSTDAELSVWRNVRSKVLDELHNIERGVWAGCKSIDKRI